MWQQSFSLFNIHTVQERIREHVILCSNISISSNSWTSQSARFLNLNPTKAYNPLWFINSCPSVEKNPLDLFYLFTSCSWWLCLVLVLNMGSARHEAHRTLFGGLLSVWVVNCTSHDNGCGDVAGHQSSLKLNPMWSQDLDLNRREMLLWLR